MKHEAEKRGYIHWPSERNCPELQDYGFDVLCFDLLNMAPPNPRGILSDDRRKALLSTKIEDLDFSVHSYNRLKRANVNYIADIIALSDSELLAIPRLSIENYDEIVGKLSMLGLELKDELALE